MSEVVTIRKKPIQIQAIKWTGSNFAEVQKFTNGQIEIGNDGLEVYDFLHDSWIKVRYGDYILQGLKGEFYPHAGDLIWDAYDMVL
jgi:hypothetical protein